MHKKAIEIKERILGSEVCLTGSWCDRYVPIHYRPDLTKVERFSQNISVKFATSSQILVELLFFLRLRYTMLKRYGPIKFLYLTGRSRLGQINECLPGLLETKYMAYFFQGGWRGVQFVNTCYLLYASQLNERYLPVISHNIRSTVVKSMFLLLFFLTLL